MLPCRANERQPNGISPAMRAKVRVLLCLRSAALQVCWEKFCEYWDVEGRYVPVTKDYPVSIQASSDPKQLS